MITRISVIGIAVITMALVVVLSAFNGIETMISNLYSEFDTDLTIRIEKGKSFNQNRIDLDKIKELEEVAYVSRVVEEVVILKRDKKWVDAKMIGVEPAYLRMTKMSEHMVDGKAKISENGNFRGIIGASVLDKLEGYIPKQIGQETIICYVPKRDAKIRLGKSPFETENVVLSGSINYNREVNSQFIILPIELTKQLMNYDEQISAIYVDAKPGIENSELKEKVEKIVGNEFVVKTSYEKNELIFQTSQSERIIVLIILLFIFVLAAFTLVASLTMLFVEKLENLKTMVSFGMPRKNLFRIFFLEGILISGKGIVIGLILGYFFCFLQLKLHLITMPNSNGEPFPISFSLSDGLMIFGLVSSLAILFSYLPVKYLIRSNVPK